MTYSAEHDEHLRRHILFMAGHRWLHYRRLRFWWKPWTWLRPAGEFVEPPAPELFARHLEQHREAASREHAE